MNATVVSGEAPETDSDDEAQTVPPTELSNPPKQGYVVAGEDSESDNEEHAMPPKNTKTRAVAVNPNEPTVFKPSPKYDSLLHIKLREDNKYLVGQLNNLMTANFNMATNSIMEVDQQLLKSQASYQQAIHHLRTLNVNSIGIRNKLQSTLDSSFLGSIKID